MDHNTKKKKKEVDISAVIMILTLLCLSYIYLVICEGHSPVSCDTVEATLWSQQLHLLPWENYCTIRARRLLSY